MGVGQEIRRRRLEAGLSLAGLAKAAGMSASRVRRIEIEQVDPSLSTVVAIAAGLGLPVAVLFGAHADLDARQIEVGMLLESLPPAAQRIAMDRLRHLAGEATDGPGPRGSGRARSTRVTPRGGVARGKR